MSATTCRPIPIHLQGLRQYVAPPWIKEFCTSHVGTAFADGRLSADGSRR
jgi:hypothetical protein